MFIQHEQDSYVCARIIYSSLNFKDTIILTQTPHRVAGFLYYSTVTLVPEPKRIMNEIHILGWTDLCNTPIFLKTVRDQNYHHLYTSKSKSLQSDSTGWRHGESSSSATSRSRERVFGNQSTKTSLGVSI